MPHSHAKLQPDCSASCDDHVREYACRLGAAAVFDKRSNWDELIRFIRDLAQKRSPQAKKHATASSSAQCRSAMNPPVD